MIQSNETRLDSQIVRDNKEIIKQMNTGIILTAQKFVYACENSNKLARLVYNVKSKLAATDKPKKSG